MRIFKFLSPSLLIAGAAIVNAASSWGISEAIVSVQGKGASAGLKDKLSDRAPLSKPITLGASDSLKIILTAVEGKTPKRPHQALLLVKDADAGLETSYPFSVKESGKGKVDLVREIDLIRTLFTANAVSKTLKDLPAQFLTTSKPLEATLLLGSFGTSSAFSSHVFNLNLAPDPSVPFGIPEKPLRYGKLNEIHHIFRPDPKSPPIVITLVFLAAVIACLPALFISWLSLGANVDHLSNALRSSPISHVLFFGSILAMEGIFFLYYTKWNLFQTLPAAVIVGAISFLSGSRALTEVQERRLSGLR
ncbi:hypothetical protein FGG08_007436 [Glutinoglossum americanum]|uniref:Ribophorin II C-terminal domain-containing protein n=1 Tax=Glutinoglossum americanum TaxID=1670608 RepID=A0A9P8KZC0_9PEZI|nr:hypothetical protein FGG08_007436 [Glutinoglossum americanum]